MKKSFETSYWSYCLTGKLNYIWWQLQCRETKFYKHLKFYYFKKFHYSALLKNYFFFSIFSIGFFDFEHVFSSHEPLVTVVPILEVRCGGCRVLLEIGAPSDRDPPQRKVFSFLIKIHQKFFCQGSGFLVEWGPWQINTGRHQCTITLSSLMYMCLPVLCNRALAHMCISAILQSCIFAFVQ